jgi:hypothetical protein
MPNPLKASTLLAGARAGAQFSVGLSKLGAAVAFALMFAHSASGVVPLVTDDADTVEPRKLQLSVGGLLDKTAGEQLYIFPANLVMGVSARGEVGATFGYQWRDGAGRAPDKSNAGGSTDLLLATKWQLWRTSDEAFKLSTRVDLKLPVASRSRGFGTGDFDGGLVLIATRSWGTTSLDWNIGYQANDLTSGAMEDDGWFLGQAVRQKLDERWTIIGEIYAVLPHTGQGGSANFHFSGGAQFTVHENLLISAVIGSAAGHHSPDLTGYLGFTVVY